MSRPVHVLLAAVLALTSVHAQLPEPTFRSGVRVVTVNASVERGRRPLPGLTSNDFAVLDNGVPQTVTQVDYETIPMDVTVIVDVSGSAVSGLDAMQRDANRIASFLRPAERLRMLAIDTYAQEIVPLGAAKAVVVRPLATIGGWSAVHDALAAALLVPTIPDRRKLVVALTDGLDNASVTTGAQLVNIARGTDSVLMVVQVPSRAAGRPVKLAYLTGEHDLRAISEAVRISGGEVFRASGRIFGNNQTEAVERLIDAFRQSYVLRYTPTGVDRGGWHEIDVRVKGQRDTTVRARRGYFGG